MKSCGNITLRQLFEKQPIDYSLLKKGISNYTKLQRLNETELPELLALNMFDWRLHHFPLTLFKPCLKRAIINKGWLIEKELKRLQELVYLCKQLCEDLSSYSISETISHSDFQDNNMVFDYKTATISIIDWGEMTIAHPFFSLNGCLGI